MDIGPGFAAAAKEVAFWGANLLGAAVLGTAIGCAWQKMSNWGRKDAPQPVRRKTGNSARHRLRRYSKE